MVVTLVMVVVVVVVTMMLANEVLPTVVEASGEW